MLPTSTDEPAIQDGLTNAVVKLVLGVLAGGGLVISDQFTAAITAFVASLVAAGLAYVQAKSTREKVYAPATVDGMTDGLSPAPADGEDVPINR